MIFQLSDIKINVNVNDMEKNDNLNIEMKSSLRKISLPQMEKEFDLMMLWHNKKPFKKQAYSIKSYEV